MLIGRADSGFGAASFAATYRSTVSNVTVAAPLD
jgi:hypothetical protein